LTFQPPAATLSKDHLAFLRSVDSPTIANAVETFKVRDRTDGFLGGAIRCLFPDLGVMVGQALTVTVGNEPGEPASRNGYWRMWEALEQMPGPSVLVMHDVSGRPSRCAYAGEVMATLAQRLGVVGMVTDGGYRDVDEVHALAMHYYAAFHVVSHGNFSIVDVGVPVELDGQRVETGDILHGDVNGIVIVPTQTLDGLPDAVAQIRDREHRVMQFIRGDSFSLDGVKSGRGY
jgi:4-hydroxy-4-methyl-2-oxoglutarate aldolase